MRKLFFPEIGNQKNIQRKAKQKPLPAENPLFHYFIPSVTYFHLLHETQCVRVLKTQVRAPPPRPHGPFAGACSQRGEMSDLGSPSPSAAAGAPSASDRPRDPGPGAGRTPRSSRRPPRPASPARTAPERHAATPFDTFPPP